MEWAEIAKNFERWERSGIQVSESAPREKPELFEDLRPLWDAWRLGHGSRPITGFGPCPMAPSEWVTILDVFGLLDDPDAAEENLSLVLALDQKWVALAHKKSGDRPKSGG